MRGKVPSLLDALEDHGRHQRAVQRHLARQRRNAGQATPTPTKECPADRAADIEAAARDVVVSWMAGEPVERDIQVLRRALGIECSPV